MKSITALSAIILLVLTNDGESNDFPSLLVANASMGMLLKIKKQQHV